MSNNSKKQTSELDVEIEKRNKLCEIYISLENKGLSTKTATLQDTRINYCRGKDLVKFFNENQGEISKKIYSICGEDIGKGDNSINNFYHVMMSRRVMLKADKFDEDLKKAYPKKVKPLPPQEIPNFDEKKLYVVFIERPVQKSTYIYLFLIIFSVLAACLFPIWPLWLKLFVWWALFIILLSLLAFMIIRIVVYITFWIFGLDVWVFPYFLCEGIGFIESLKYPYLIEKRQDSWSEVCFRICILALFIFCCIHVWMYPEILTLVNEWVSWIYNEGLNWGYNKLTNYHNKSNTLTVADKHKNVMNSFNDDF